MAGDNLLDVVHAAVARLNCVFVDGLSEFAGKQLIERMKNFSPMLVGTLLLFGGLNQVVLLLVLSLIFFPFLLPKSYFWKSQFLGIAVVGSFSFSFLCVFPFIF